MTLSTDRNTPENNPEGSLPGKQKRRVNNGEPSTDLVFSAYEGSNELIFPKILSLYVPPGSVVADVTYGKGVFWKGVS